MNTPKDQKPNRRNSDEQTPDGQAPQGHSDTKPMVGGDQCPCAQAHRLESRPDRSRYINF